MSLAPDPRRDWHLLHDWRVTAGPRSALAVSVDPRETPFIGREDMLRQARHLASMARAGHGRVVAVLGEPGIGKSRLLHELAARGPALGLETSWIDRAASAHWAAERGGDSSCLPTAAGRPAVAGLPAIAGDAAFRPRLVVCDLGPSVHQLAVLASLAATDLSHRPLLLLIGLSRVAAGAPDVRDVLSAFARQRTLIELEVPPLDESEIFAMASHVLGGPPDARLQAEISSLSEGNPFLAEAVARDLARLGLVTEAHGTRYLPGELSREYVPAVVESVLRYELEGVEASQLGVLVAAAALGTGFRLDVLSAAIDRPPGEVLAHLEAGAARGLLRESSEPPDDFQFVHELTRRVLYRRLGFVRRRGLHQAIADVLERQATPGRAGTVDSSLAFHFSRGADARRALTYTLRALRRAEQLCAWDEAIRCCREALDLSRQLDAPDEALQLDLLERLGALYFGQAQTFATGTCWREALRLCEETGRIVEQAVFVGRLASLGTSWGAIEAAEQLLARAEAAAIGELERRTWLSDAYLSVGFAQHRLGSISRALDHFQRARDLADPTDWTRYALTLVSLASPLTSAGRPAEAVAILRSTLETIDARLPELLAAGGHIFYYRDPRRLRCLVLEELARGLAYLNQTDEALQLARASHQEQLRLRIVGAQGHGAVALAELRRGQPLAALEAFASRLRETSAGLLSAHRTADLALLAEAQLASGNRELALETASEGIRISERTGAHESLAAMQIVAAEALLAGGRVDEAHQMVRAAHRTIDDIGTEIVRPAARRVEAAVRSARVTLALPRQRERPSRQERPSVATAERANDAAAGARRPSARGAPGRPAQRPAGARARTRTGSTSGLRLAASVRPRQQPMLSARERDVLVLIAEGRTNRQVAAALVISDLTVKRHLSNIFNKLGVSARAAVVRRAFELGLL